MCEPAQIGLLNAVIVGGAQPMALLLVEEAELDVVEPALKAYKSFSGDIPKRIVAPINDIVAHQVTFVVLFDAVTLDGVVEEESKVRPQLEPVPRHPSLSPQGLIGIGKVIDEAQILPFGISPLA